MKTKFIKFVMALMLIIEGFWPGQQARSQTVDDENFSPSFSANSFFLSAPPSFSAGTRIKANGVDLRADTYASAPCVTDWNGDGKKDLLVGCFYNGNVYLYLNSGSNSSPVFTTGSKLQADGAEISVAYG